MGSFGLDLGLGLVSLILWLASAPLIYRVVRRIAQGPNAEQRVLVGEGLMLLHLVLLVLTLVGLLDAAWDLM